MAIDIPSLFRDVIETPQQRQRRKLSEAVALAPQARGGIASLLNPLAQAASINLQQGSEGLGRSVGGMLGLDMRDTSQKVSDELLGADLSSSTGMRDLSKAINRYAPVQAMGLLQAADEREQAEAERKLINDLREREMTVAEGRLSVNKQQAETAAGDLELRSTQQQDLQDWRRITDKNADADRVIKEQQLRVDEEINRLKSEELGSRAIAYTNELQEEAASLEKDGVAARSLAKEFEANLENIDSGALARLGEKWKTFMGNENKVSELRQQYRAIRNTAALGGLPPGAASDKDIEMAMSGFPTDTANPELIARWLRGVEKMSFLASERANAHLQFIAENRGASVMLDSETGEAITFNDFYRRKLNENEGRTFVETMNKKYGDQGLNILSAEAQQAADNEAERLRELEAENQRRSVERERASSNRQGQRLQENFNPQI